MVLVASDVCCVGGPVYVVHHSPDGGPVKKFAPGDYLWFRDDQLVQAESFINYQGTTRVEFVTDEELETSRFWRRIF